MQLTMTKTCTGSRDGMHVETFEAGQAYAFTTEHELGLAKAFVELGAAEEVKAKPEQKPGPDANKSQKQPEIKTQGEQK